MSELLLTKEEEQVNNLFDLSDESLGKIVRHWLVSSTQQPQSSSGGRSGLQVVSTVGAAVLLIMKLREADDTFVSKRITGLQDQTGESLGDWEFMASRVSDEALGRNQKIMEALSLLTSECEGICSDLGESLDKQVITDKAERKKAGKRKKRIEEAIGVIQDMLARYREKSTSRT